MFVLKIITTVLIVMLMLVIMFFMRSIDSKAQKASVVGFGIMEIVYGMAILCMWV